jgi:hypothetical protein
MWIVAAVAACSSPTPATPATPVAPATPAAPLTSSAPSSVPQTEAAPAEIPDVTGKRLTDAEQILAAAGYQSVRAVDATGDGRPVLQKDNWVVESQDPGAGSTAPAQATVVLGVSKPTDGQSTPETADGVIPKVVCQDLQSAQDALRGAGFFLVISKDGLGQNRVALVDRNWIVVGQSVKPGSRPEPSTVIELTVVKYGEDTGGSGCRS